MKNKLFRRAAVLTAALFSLTCMSVTAYAQSDEPAEETTPPAATETVAKPFTPDGTGTVVDNATDEDGKEFFTITTPSENVFYLVIDRQRTEENVYFLNAVTEKDLLALAEATRNPRSRSLSHSLSLTRSLLPSRNPNLKKMQAFLLAIS